MAEVPGTLIVIALFSDIGRAEARLLRCVNCRLTILIGVVVNVIGWVSLWAAAKGYDHTQHAALSTACLWHSCMFVLILSCPLWRNAGRIMLVTTRLLHLHQCNQLLIVA